MIGMPRRSAGDTARWITRLLAAWRRCGDVEGTFERVDSAVLGSATFRASDSMGLDDAPAIVRRGDVPSRPHDIDRRGRSRR